jgi:hypothetical protein
MKSHPKLTLLTGTAAGAKAEADAMHKKVTAVERVIVHSVNSVPENGIL